MNWQHVTNIRLICAPTIFSGCSEKRTAVNSVAYVKVRTLHFMCNILFGWYRSMKCLFWNFQFNVFQTQYCMYKKLYVNSLIHISCKTWDCLHRESSDYLRDEIISHLAALGSHFSRNISRENHIHVCSN